MIGEEKLRRAKVAHEIAEENRLAILYHSQFPAAYQDKTRVWVKPVFKMAGYASGSIVWHNEKKWVNQLDGVNMNEPGTDDTWVDLETLDWRPVD